MSNTEGQEEREETVRTIQRIPNPRAPEHPTIYIGRELGQDAHEGVEGKRWHLEEVGLKRYYHQQRIIKVQKERHTSGDLSKKSSDEISLSVIKPCSRAVTTRPLSSPAREGLAPSKVPRHSGKS